MKKIKRLLKFLMIFSIVIIALTAILNIIIIRKSHKYLYDHVADVPECYTAIVLGAKVSSSGTPSDFLQDRLDVAINKKPEFLGNKIPIRGDSRLSYD